MAHPRYAKFYTRPNDEPEYHIFASLKDRKRFWYSIPHDDPKYFRYATMLTPKQFKIATSPGWIGRPAPVIVDHHENLQLRPQPDLSDK